MQKVYESARELRDSIPTTEAVTLVGGSFDLLHVGHVRLLEYSKTLGSILVVCVLSDSNVKSYKGPKRPVVGELYRAQMVAALRCVDHVYISDIDTSAEETLSIIQPDNVVFGIEDRNQRSKLEIKREKFIRSFFPTVAIHYLDRFANSAISTSALVQRILNVYKE